MTDLKLSDGGIKLKGYYTVEVRSAYTKRGQKAAVGRGRLIMAYQVENLVLDVGAASIAARLVGQSNKGLVSYLALGSGSTSPVSGNTALQNEFARKRISVIGNEANTVVARVFFNANEANGSIREIGLYGDEASGVVDSGTLFARSLLPAPVTKTTGLTLTFTYFLTIH